MNTPHHSLTDTPDDALPVEPVLPLVARSGLGDHPLGHATGRAKVLEVSQLWEEMMVDTRHFRLTRDDAVSIGADLGHRWRFLGIDMGWVPRPLATVLPYAPPMWSEVTTEWRGDFHAPDQSLPGHRDHQLFVRRGDRYEAQLLPSFEGYAELDGQRIELADLARAGLARASDDELVVPMVEGLRLLVRIDGVAFYAHLVPEGQPLPRRGAAVDYPLIAVGSTVGFVGLLIGLVALFAPRPPQHELVQVPERILQLVVEAPEPDPSGPPPREEVDPGEGAKPAGDEGTRGEKSAKHKVAKGSPREVAERTRDRQVAEAAGVLGALAELGASDGMFASAALDGQVADLVGGLRGPDGTRVGTNGLGRRGSDLGGGGEIGSVGDGMGTRGLGTGRTGYGSDGGRPNAKGQGVLTGVGGEPIVLGSLERSAIDEVIKRHLQQIRYCYQRELQRAPELAGKVVVKFTIAADGSVAAASPRSSSLGNASVEQCLTGRFLRMQFPEPMGGGVVIVSYPFVFGR